MPTSHVLPESTPQLQAIADALWKAKKVLVVTGAGISTNSGIPDFRSRNGLYSLIQAQFEAAASSKDDEPSTEPDAEPETDDEPPAKRRRLDGQAPSAGPADMADGTATRRTSSRRLDGRGPQDTIRCAPRDAVDDGSTIVVSLPLLDPKAYADAWQTPQPKSRVGRVATSHAVQALGSSSPLSSPPSVLFDPAEAYSSGCTSSARSASSNSSLSASTCCSSDSDADADVGVDSDPDEAASAAQPQPTLSSQSSFASTRSTLPAMKGRDLFDASIWADPVKTSVFYTFATTLRQKVREVAPTRSHEFISHLRDTNKLVRCYTQNIDEMEEKVGLTTSLVLGPGKKGRFSARSLSRSASQAASADAGNGPKDNGANSQEPPSSSQQTQASEDAQEPAGSQVSQPANEAEANAQPEPKRPPARRDPGFRGVECVFLHGSLRQLRCFRCGQTTPWDEGGREHETLSGRQPSCPRCAGATAAREGRGKRALAVGKLRPDIVLYGEEHPNAHLISPLVQHDIALAPDMLLILGTSLRVHGLKVLIREFSKAVHSRGGKVVFVNFTKPPESVWSDVIDYWVQWDCDAWVDDLKTKKPVLWLPPGSAVAAPKAKRKSTGPGSKSSRRKSEDAGAVQAYEGCAKAAAADQGSGEDTATRTEPPKEPRRKRGPGGRTKGKDDKSETYEREGSGAMAPASGAALQAVSPAAGLPTGVWDDRANGAFMVWKIRQELAKATDVLAPHAPTAPPVPVPLAGVSASAVAGTPSAPDRYSILSAVKANPRRRKSKKIFEEGSGTGPVLVPVQTTAAPAKERRQPTAKARQRSKSLGAAAAPAAGGPAPGTAGAGHAPQPYAGAPLPSIKQLFPDLQPLWRRTNPFFLQDPLGGGYGFPPAWPQEGGCTGQLRREDDERLRAAVRGRRRQG